MSLSNILVYVIIAMFILSLLKNLGIDITTIIGFILHRRPKFKDNDPDVLIRLKKLYVAAGKSQRGEVKRLEFNTDEHRPSIGPYKVKSILHDSRGALIGFKPGAFRFSKILIVPQKYIGGQHNKVLTVDANGWIPFDFGMYAMPIMRKDNIEEIEPMKQEIIELLENLMNTEQLVLTLERGVHNTLTAPGMDKLDSRLIMGDEFIPTPGQEVRTSE
jgi:hypothetical protein